MSPLVSPSSEHAVWGKQREAEQHSTYCSGLGTEVLRPSTPMLLLGLLTTWGLGGRTCDMHRDISSNTAPTQQQAGNKENHQYPTGTAVGLALSLCHNITHECGDMNEFKDEYKPHSPTKQTSMLVTGCLLLALCCLVWAGFQRKGSLAESFPCAVCLCALDIALGTGLSSHTMTLLATCSRNPTSQVMISVQASTGKCVLRRNVLNLSSFFIKICFLPAAEHKPSLATLSLSLLVLSQTSAVCSKIRSFSVEDDIAPNPISYTYPSPSNVWKFSLISDQDPHKQTSLHSWGILCWTYLCESNEGICSIRAHCTHQIHGFVNKVQLCLKKSQTCWPSSMLISTEMPKYPNKAGNATQLKGKELFTAYSLSALQWLRKFLKNIICWGRGNFQVCFGFIFLNFSSQVHKPQIFLPGESHQIVCSASALHTSMQKIAAALLQWIFISKETVHSRYDEEIQSCIATIS